MGLANTTQEATRQAAERHQQPVEYLPNSSRKDDHARGITDAAVEHP